MRERKGEGQRERERGQNAWTDSVLGAPASPRPHHLLEGAPAPYFPYVLSASLFIGYLLLRVWGGQDAPLVNGGVWGALRERDSD